MGLALLLSLAFFAKSGLVPWQTKNAWPHHCAGLGDLNDCGPRRSVVRRLLPARYSRRHLDGWRLLDEIWPDN